jgi:C1A family cysteine protease
MENKPHIHRYNWKQDKRDERDHKFSKHGMLTASLLPEKIDLREHCPPIVNQGNVGSCTGNALAGALGLLEILQLEDGFNRESFEFSANFTPLSRLFIYWNERVIEGVTDQDAGAQLRDGIKSLFETGCCSESTWPYNEDATFTPPAGACFAEAGLHKIVSYSAIDNANIHELKSCLARGLPFVFGFMVSDSFESEEVAATGIMKMPLPNENFVGGHAVMGVGYDDDKQVFIVRNSWGTEWGDKGYFYMPYAFISDPNLAKDFWVIKK